MESLQWGTGGKLFGQPQGLGCCSRNMQFSFGILSIPVSEDTLRCIFRVAS